MVNKNVLRSRIEKVYYHFSRIKPAGKVSLELFQRNQDLQDIVEYNLFQIINHILDICQHVVVDESLGLPKSAYEAVEILQKNKLFSSLDAQKLKKMIGFRNIVGHDYLALDKKIVFDIWKKKLIDIQRIVDKITEKYL